MYSGARCSVVDPARGGVNTAGDAVDPARGGVHPSGVPLERSFLLTSVSTLGSCGNVFAASTDRLLYHQRQSVSGVSEEFSGLESRGRRAWKNLVVLSVAFMFLFSALVSLHSMQSSINPRSAVGVLSLSCVHGAAVVSCFLAPVVIARLTTKWTLVVSAGVCLLYAVVANVHPKDFTLVPSSLLLGLLTGPMWSAQAVHLSRLAVDHADAARLDPDATLARFNGVFCGFFALSQVWGHVLSAVVLVEAGSRLSPVNESHIHSVCGAADCGRLDAVVSDRVADTAHHLRPVTASTRHLLLCAHVGCIVVALALTATLLDGASHSRPSKGKSVAMSGALKALGDPRLLLLAPLVVFVGLEQGFIFADFTKSYINCALGVHKIGPVLVGFGSVNAVSAVCIGHVVKHVKRYPIMLSGAIFNTGLFMVLLWWRPCRQDVAMFYVIAACLGLCDAIWQTQTNTLFAVLFGGTLEEAFSCYRLLQAVGMSVAFGYSHFLCVATKVYVMAALLAVALLLYTVVETRLQRHKKCIEGVVVL